MSDPQQTKPPVQPPKRTDYAIAMELLGNSLCETKTCGNRWWVYESNRWKEETRNRFRPIVLAKLPELQRTAKRERAILDLIEGLCQADENLFRSAYMFEPDGSILLNVHNCTLRITPTEIKQVEHDLKHHFTRALAVSYDPSAECPIYNRVLKESLPDPEDQNLFQLFMGNLLFPSARYESFLVCYGPSGCGKSTLADPVVALFGNDNLCTSLSMLQICDPKSYSLPKLDYACVNLGTELQGNTDSGIIKQIVTGETIDTRAIYDRPFAMKTVCKLWFLSNNLPQFKNGSDAEARRLRFLRFDQKPAKVDTKLKETLLTELPGILNFMLAGLQRLMNLPVMPHGGERSRNVSTYFDSDNDAVGTFVATRCTLGPELKVEKNTLYQSFKDYCDTKGFEEKSESAFFKLLYARYPDVEDTRNRIAGSRIRSLIGIALKPDYANPLQTGFSLD